MSESAVDFKYFVSLSRLNSPPAPGRAVYEVASVDLESLLLDQAARLGRYPLWLLAFEDYRVSWGYLDGAGLHWPPGGAVAAEFLQELRVEMGLDEAGRLDAVTRKLLACKIMERLSEGRERYEKKRQSLQYILFSQARHVATFVRGDLARPYQPFVCGW